MVFAALPIDVNWAIVEHLLIPRYGRIEHELRERQSRSGFYASRALVGLVSASSTCRDALSIRDADARYKGIMLCMAPPRVADDEFTRSFMDGFFETPPPPHLHVPAAWSEDRVIVLAAVKLLSRTLHCVPRFLDDKEIVIAALEGEDRDEMPALPEFYTIIPENLRLDLDVARAALLEGRQSMFYSTYYAREFPEAIRDNKTLMLDVVGLSTPLFMASERLRADRDVVLRAVSSTSQSYEPNLQYASEALRDDRVIVEAAISAGAGLFSLRFASERLRDDDDLVSAAIEHTGRVLFEDKAYVEGYQSLSPRLQNQASLFLRLLDGCGGSKTPAKLLRLAPVTFRDDESIIRAATAKDHTALRYASARLRGDREIVLAVLARNGLGLQFAARVLRGDRACVLAAVRQVGTALQYASTALRDDFDVVVAACQNEGAALEYVSRRLRDDRNVRAVARAERAALLERIERDGRWGWTGGYDRSQRAEAFNRRYRFGGGADARSYDSQGGD